MVKIRIYAAGVASGVVTVSRVPNVGEEMRVLGMRYVVRGVMHIARAEGEPEPEVVAEVGLAWEVGEG
jgi:hypothetical protein